MRPLTSDLLLRAYAMGIFPMARSRTDQRLYWIDPDQRGILPLNDFHIPRSLCKTMRRQIFELRVDTAFEAVMEGCAQTTSGRPDTWINDEIVRLFVELHHLGMAHSVETWREGRLVGGLYGLSLGGTFFGESMFSRETDASKVALVDLVARMKRAGYLLLDTQFVTDHLSRFGATEIPRHQYLKLLSGAVDMPAVFPRGPVEWTEALRQSDVRV